MELTDIAGLQRVFYNALLLLDLLKTRYTRTKQYLYVSRVRVAGDVGR